MTAQVRLTTKDLTRAFGVTPMTITNWRKGTPTRTALPAIIKGRNVVYSAAQVEKWAQRNEVLLVEPLTPQGREKPGPKLRHLAEAT